nr:synaptobrevin, longin-like domain protein [Tanacetum cinerariifolium]
DEFPLPEQLPTAYEDKFPLLIQSDATAERITMLLKVAFYEYHNMIAILEKYEHNQDFHQIVDFVRASHIRIETTEEGTKILVTVDGNLRTVSESSIRRNLKLNDEACISSLPDAELFENLQLMGYNILPNQKFTFQKGQFSHQCKYHIHTIMQCMSPKSTVFNEFSSNIATALVCLASNRVYNFSKMVFDGMVRNVNNKVSKFLMYPRFLSKCLKMGQFGKITHTYTIVLLFDSMPVPQGEGSRTPTASHHTPTSEASQSSQHELPSPSLPPVTTVTVPPVILTSPLSTVIPTDTTLLRHYTRRARIAQSSVLPHVADEPASSLGDGSQGEACPTDSGFVAEQDRENIAKTSTLPSDSAPRVTSLAADKGNEGEEAAERVSNNTKEMINVLTSMDATTVLSSGVAEVPTGSEMERYAQRMNEQIARDAEIARIHAEEELQMMINSLDRSNETVAKYLQEYELILEDLSIGERIELICDLGRIVGNKMHKAFPLPVMEFPLSEEVPTASEESSHCQKKRDAPTEKIALLLKSSSNCQSKSYDSY